MAVAVRCTLRAVTGLPRDDCINTFYVDGIGLPGTSDADVRDAFISFFNDTTSSGNSVSSYINDTILRTDGLLIELIDTPDAPPNVPYAAILVTLDATSATPLPQEVACCLTYTSADYYTGGLPGRARGRVYIGPLSVDAGADSGTNLVSRPNSAFQETLRDAASTLLSTLAGATVDWVLWSRADTAFKPIVGGWVDNEWDTQRRRGQSATGRTFWP